MFSCFQRFCPSIHSGVSFGEGVGDGEFWGAGSSAWLTIMHCSLPVISLLTCCQKETLEACICLYSQAARHSGILAPPSFGHEHFLAYSKSDIGTTAVRGKQSRFELPLCLKCFWRTQAHMSFFGPTDAVIKTRYLGHCWISLIDSSKSCACQLKIWQPSAISRCCCCYFDTGGAAAAQLTVRGPDIPEPTPNRDEVIYEPLPERHEQYTLQEGTTM